MGNKIIKCILVILIFEFKFFNSNCFILFIYFKKKEYLKIKENIFIFMVRNKTAGCSPM